MKDDNMCQDTLAKYLKLSSKDELVGKCFHWYDSYYKITGLSNIRTFFDHIHSKSGTLLESERLVPEYSIIDHPLISCSDIWYDCDEVSLEEFNKVKSEIKI